MYCEKTEVESHITTPYLLPNRWRELAESEEAFKNDQTAAALRFASEELESALRDDGDELLNLPDAASESRYSADHLGRRVREGSIRNSGRPGAPRIARRDLPRKPVRHIEPVAQPAEKSDISNAQIVQSIIDEGVS